MFWQQFIRDGGPAGADYEVVMFGDISEMVACG
jgi:hypothetical protein